LTTWQVAHGYSTGSGVGSEASSARLVGVVSREAGAQRGGSSGLRRAAKGPGGIRRQVVEGGSPQGSPVAADGSPSFIDTSSDLLRPTVKGSGAGGPSKGSGGGVNRALPVAERLQNTVSEYVIDDELPSAIARLRSPSSLTGHDLDPYLARYKSSVSKWFWTVATVGTVLALILLLIGLLSAVWTV
jgi:hypothetical protein